MYLSATVPLSAPVTRQYFESSVYRNLLDMIATLDTIRGELWQASKVLGLFSSNKRVYAFKQPQKPVGWPGPMAIGYAVNRGSPYRDDYRAWYWLVTPLFLGKRAVPGYSPNPPVYYSFAQASRALINARSISLDLRARIRNLEWELNRVHLPMVEGLRSWSDTLDQYVRRLPSSLPPETAMPSEYRPVDTARIVGYEIGLQVAKLKKWLDIMRQKVIERDRTDQAALLAQEQAAKAAAAAAAAQKAAAEAEAAKKAAAEAAAKKAAEAAQRAAAEAAAAQKVAQEAAAKRAAQEAAARQEATAQPAAAKSAGVVPGVSSKKGGAGAALLVTGAAITALNLIS